MRITDEYFDGRGSRSIRTWEYPDCPNCGVEIYVRIENGTGKKFHCVKCDEKFLPDPTTIRMKTETDLDRKKRRYGWE